MRVKIYFVGKSRQEFIQWPDEIPLPLVGEAFYANIADFGGVVKSRTYFPEGEDGYPHPFVQVNI